MSTPASIEITPLSAVSAKCTERLPELLAPAGDWECAKAAVENGADAIYFGLERFNARMRAQNFTQVDLPKLMEFLHRRGVRGYVTFNTLVFTDELEQAEEYLRSIIAAGVDAAIVQDVGICRLIRQLSPDFPIHSSTQMTVTSAAGVEFSRALGCSLVVLARENSIKEINAIQSAENLRPDVLRVPPMPLEVFVHGALCVAYSGQCLTSEALGGRSANRGECAQACRMPYELLSDGKKVDLGDRRYLLSPQDLSGIEVLPDLIRAGVRSLKIEGRLKSPEYVASVTRVYRQALDRLAATLNLEGFREQETSWFDRNDRYELEMSFSRGLYPGWFRGVNNQKLAHARFGKKRGVYLGSIVEVQGDSILVKLQGPLKLGDGLVVDAGIGDDHEVGGRVTSLATRGELTQVWLHGGQVHPGDVKKGSLLWKTSDPALSRKVRDTFEGEKIRRLSPVSMDVSGCVGAPLNLVVSDDAGHTVYVQSVLNLVPAEKHALDESSLRQQLGRLGGTPYELRELRVVIEGRLMLPMSELNRLRRSALQELDLLRARPSRWTLSTPSPSVVSEMQQPTSSVQGEPELIVLVRTIPQLEAALNCGIETLYCDFDDTKKYRDAVSRFREFQAARDCSNPRGPTVGPHPSIWVAPPRIFKPGEEWILKQVLSCDADGYLLRNYEHLQFFTGVRRRGDFSFNVANPLTAEYFVVHQGLERVTASYDLNVAQLEALLKATPRNWIEITLHQHMPMFHMEHCVFCAFLSSGTDFTNCGRPCDHHDVRLKDRMGLEHPLKADSGCRNTVFSSRAQSGAEFFGRLCHAGGSAFRIEFVTETAEEVKQIVGRYRALIRGETTGTALWQGLKLQSQLGVTRGQLERAEIRQVTSKKDDSSR